MCGIFGWFGAVPENPVTLFETLSPLLRHRGPDDKGFEQGAGWGLGFRRLSILDLSHLGHQPMHSADQRFWIAFNGEIYNYIELRNQLEQQGEKFQGTSDTEVLLRLLAREGVHGLKQLNGMFALAFVDTKERTFFLARDRLGQKPLYYSFEAGQFRFASELKCLLAWPDASRQLAPQAVAQYLTLGYLPNETCIFQEYYKVPPGHFLTGSLDTPKQVTTSPYWQLEITGERCSNEFSANDLEELIDLLSNAVQIRLRSDVPVGVFLSGGIDSGLVAALAAKAERPVHPLALTIGFSEKNYDETTLAQVTANHLGLEHKIIPQRANNIDDIDRLAWFYDEPFGDASALPTLNLCEAASAHATVFLSGDGGDETFGGYRRYIESQHYNWLSGLPSVISRGMRQLSALLPFSSPIGYRLLKSSLPDEQFAAVFDGQGLSQDPVLKMILHPELKGYATTANAPVLQRWGQSSGKDILTRQQKLDYALYLPDDILVKVDRASMAHSIEVRSPFLDYRLIEWAAHLNRALLTNQTMGKLPLRSAANALLPQLIQQGEKRGFGIPLNDWFREPTGYKFIQNRLLSHEAGRKRLWDLDGVQKILTAHQKRKGRNFGEILWRLLMLDAWSRHYLNGNTFLQGPPK